MQTVTIDNFLYGKFFWEEKGSGGHHHVQNPGIQERIHIAFSVSAPGWVGSRVNVPNHHTIGHSGSGSSEASYKVSFSFWEDVLGKEMEISLLLRRRDGTTMMMKFTFMIPDKKGLVVNGDFTCPICLDEVEDDLVVTSCRHAFHGACFSQRRTKPCPVCRQEPFPTGER